MKSSTDNVATIKSDQTDDDKKLYREIPYNIEAEQILLGTILTNNESINRMGDFLGTEHFFLEVHKKIFSAIVKFVDKGLVANPVTLKGYFENDEMFVEIGGAKYLNTIAALSTGIIEIRTHADIIYSLAISRQLISVGEDMVNDAYGNTGDERASEQIEKTEQKLFNLASEGSSDSSFTSLRLSVGDAIASAENAARRKGAINGVTTGFLDMDRLLGGFHNSDLIILAARPSMGKTALALNFALTVAKKFVVEEVAKQDNAEKEIKSVGVFSLEMSSEQLATRLLSVETGINSGDIRRGKISKDPRNNEFDKLVEASQELHDTPLFIDDTPALTISAVRTRARRLKRKHNLAFLVIDYLQLLRGTSDQAKSNRVQEISEITMGLKAIAKELNIPVVALSQLSRAVESRSPPRPQLSDLRESGSIEQDADMVMFIYREEYYTEREKPSESDAAKMEEWQAKMETAHNMSEIIVAKNRNGPIGNIPLVFDKNTTKFMDLDKEHGDYQVADAEL